MVRDAMQAGGAGWELLALTEWPHFSVKQFDFVVQYPGSKM
jgi:hypothetical protein